AGEAVDCAEVDERAAELRLAHELDAHERPSVRERRERAADGAVERRPAARVLAGDPVPDRAHGPVGGGDARGRTREAAVACDEAAAEHAGEHRGADGDPEPDERDPAAARADAGTCEPERVERAADEGA